jgi:hypothetical protein
MKEPETAYEEFAAALHHFFRTVGSELGLYRLADWLNNLLTLPSILAEREALRTEAASTREALTLYADQHASDGLHEDGCPGDDTCECDKVRLVNRALSFTAGQDLLERLLRIEAENANYRKALNAARDALKDSDMTERQAGAMHTVEQALYPEEA